MPIFGLSLSGRSRAESKIGTIARRGRRHCLLVAPYPDKGRRPRANTVACHNATIGMFVDDCNLLLAAWLRLQDP